MSTVEQFNSQSKPLHLHPVYIFNIHLIQAVSFPHLPEYQNTRLPVLTGSINIHHLDYSSHHSTRQAVLLVMCLLNIVISITYNFTRIGRVIVGLNRGILQPFINIYCKESSLKGWSCVNHIPLIFVLISLNSTCSDYIMLSAGYLLAVKI